jgi:HD-GYP domain-containing protein (c-di-GMP phosphodiesterase class II)
VAAILLVYAVARIAGAPAGATGLVCGALALAAALAAAWGWRATRARADHADHAVDHARRTQREAAERLDRHVRRLESQHRQETQLLQRIRQSWKAEREWNRELRGQIQRLQTARPVHGNGSGDSRGGDVRELILAAAMQLVEAEKGLLISREDEDGDGDLDVVLFKGFEHDPTNSAVAQRFARAVLARDEILRNDSPPRPGATQASPADDEIDTLVAIPVYVRDRFSGVIVCANRPGGFEEVGDDLLLALGDHAGAALHHGRLQHELADAHRSTIRALTEAVAAHDPVLHRETCELALHAGLLAEDMALDEHARDVLITATLLRALGYLPLPDRPRMHPGPLPPDERALIELHPRLGFNVLMQAPALHEAATVLLYHHERYDGTGYPAGLSGRDIPIAARMLAVLEAFGALTHERPYRDTCTPEAACEALVEAAGTQFDPEITQLFVEQVRRAPRLTRDDVSGAVLDGLPLEAADAVTAAVDGATLLGNHQRLQQDVGSAAARHTPFGLVVVELIDLPRVNADDGHLVGDRMIREAARGVRRAAARLGGTAYRMSGRRLAILVRPHDGGIYPRMLEEVQTEFVAGPAIRAAMSVWVPGETGDALLARAREALKQPSV